jgi:heptosyltransferase-3
MINTPKRILIYRLGSLGDTVIALPVFNMIRMQFPNADITLLTNKPVVDKAAPLQSVLGDGFFFNRIINYPVGTRQLSVLFNLMLQIRGLHIDTVVYLAGVRIFDTPFKTKLIAYRDKLFFKAAGAKSIIGFPTLKEDFELSIDPVTGDMEWEAKRLARRFEVLGPIPLNDATYWDLHLTSAEEADANNVLKSLDPLKPIVAVSAGTKNQANDWEVDNWLQLIGRLKVMLAGWQLVLIGGEDEKERADKCVALWNGNAVNLCGQTSPRVSGAVLKKARFFIGHDSGPMHLAAGVGTACVAIFSAKNIPCQWFPRGEKNKVIYHKTDCAGCALDVCIAQKKKCILSITIDEVVAAVAEVLKALGDESNITYI